MAELRRQEEEQYFDRAKMANDREGVFLENDNETQSLNKPRLINASLPVENATTRSDFDTRDFESTPATMNRQSSPAANSGTPLFSTADVGDLRTRWGSVQAGFVDEPRWAVREADKLVATAMDRLTAGFSEERSTLEKQWDRGEDVSTEELRLALQRYRTFFDRLLNV